MPGVVAVFTGADLAAEQGSLPNAWPITEDMKAPPAPSLAVDTVNFAGEAVAVVVARSAYEAQDALEGIDVDYDELPVVLDLAAAAADGAELVHPRSRHQRQRGVDVRLRARQAQVPTSKRPSATPKCCCSARSDSSG